MEDVPLFDVDTIAAELLPAVLMQGWLDKKKQRGVLTASLWQRRYVVADTAERCLFYGPSQEQYRKRAIMFTEIKAVHHSYTACQYAGHRGKRVAQGHQFTLLLNDSVAGTHHNDHRQFIFQAESPGEVDLWVRTLKEASLSYNVHSVHHFHLNDQFVRRSITPNGDSASDSDEEDAPARRPPPRARSTSPWLDCLLCSYVVKNS